MNKIKEGREFKSGFYFCYPHGNGFADGGKAVVLGRRESDRASLWKFALDSGKETRICEFPVPENIEFWFDVASGANQLVVVAGNALWMFDLNNPADGRLLYKGDQTSKLSTLPSITADGGQALVGVNHGDRHALFRIDTRSGESSLLFEKQWFANHFHFSPYDEQWIGFCHEGATENISDRVWGWHPSEAAQGKCLFDQHWDEPARALCVGHERWSFHDLSAYVVAYGVSPGQPRGVYELTANGKGSRLVSEGNRDLHVNVSASGRWVVIDTSGPHDMPGRGWENSNHVSDVILIDARTGTREWLARTRIDSHPYHPHPVFSPDEKLIFYNEANVGERTGRVMCVENPWC